jgi:cbb3-type cytochrome oxidase subunit 3
MTTDGIGNDILVQSWLLFFFNMTYNGVVYYLYNN